MTHKIKTCLGPTIDRTNKEKNKIANKNLARIKKCSTCGKDIRERGISLTGTYVNGRFKVHKFCNGKCFDNMPDLEHPEFM